MEYSKELCNGQFRKSMKEKLFYIGSVREGVNKKVY